LGTACRTNLHPVQMFGIILAMNRFKKPVLALGAESKGVFSFVKGGNLFTSNEFGNLGDYNNFARYEASIKDRMRKIKPRVIVCDMHPDYNSHALARDLSLKNGELIEVQHHHAHIASCMLENDLKGKVIGVAFDGTGYGPDNNIWGGEFLISSYKDFTRMGHFKYLPMPGADMAVKEPWRMAASYLYDAFGDSSLRLGIPFTKKIPVKEWRVLRGMISKGINSPLTSSAGRLFDAASAITSSIFKVAHEAQAPVSLQRLAEEAWYEEGLYPYDIQKKGLVIDVRKTIMGIVKDIKSNVAREIVSARFHNTIAAIINDMCMRIKAKSGIRKIALSGGVFQNALLTEKTERLLEESGFSVYKQAAFSMNDSGVSRGQAAVASARG